MTQTPLQSTVILIFLNFGLNFISVGWITFQMAASCVVLTVPLYVTNKFNAQPYEIGSCLPCHSVCGHFGNFPTKKERFLLFFSQINITF